MPEIQQPLVVAPSGPIGDTALRRGRIRRSLWCLALRGIEPQLDADVWRKDGYLAGPDTSRARALVSALNSNRAIIWGARGGYGSMRLLPALDHLLETRPRSNIFLGFSDLTALFPMLVRKGFRCVHGPVLAQAGDLVARGTAGFPGLVRTLGGAPPRELTFCTPDPVPRDLIEQDLEGTLWGGNLTLCAALCGTPYAPDTRGSILFFEEVGEPAYRVDRSFTQLDLAGILQGAKAVLIGDLGVRGGERKKILERIGLIRDRWGIPVLTGLPIGHRRRNACLEVGVVVSLRVRARERGQARVVLRWPGCDEMPR